MSTQTNWPSAVTDAELDTLDRYLRDHHSEGRLMLDGVHGLLSALVVGPHPALPEEWLPQVLHEPFGDAEEGNRVLGLLAKLNDSIPAELELDAYEPILGEVDAEGGPALSAAGWCEGFSRAIDMRAGLWEQRLASDPTLMELLGPIMALAVDEGVLAADAEFERLSDEDYDECLTQVPTALAAVARYWLENPPTEAEEAAAAETEAVIQEAVRGDDGDGSTPPRQRSGHWLH